MSKMRITYDNHWNFGIHVTDTIKLAQKLFSSIGFEVEIAKSIDISKINILIENFDDEYTEKVMQAHKQGAEFIVIATEFLTGTTFNSFNDFNSEEHYEKKVYWKKRHDNFKKIAPISKLILHLSDIQVPIYQRAIPSTPVIYLPHVFFKSLVRFEMKPFRERDIDVLFTGTMTSYRQEQINLLSEAGFNVVVLPMLTADFHREDVVSRAKLTLNIPQSRDWAFPSNSRLYYHLLHNSPILSQETEVSCDLDRYVFHCQPDTLVAEVSELLVNEQFIKNFQLKRLSFIENDEVKINAQKEILSNLNFNA